MASGADEDGVGVESQGSEDGFTERVGLEDFVVGPGLNDIGLAIFAGEEEFVIKGNGG